MVTKQGQRSEETKKMILAAAGELFSQQGYDSVTIREIAKKAGCSHTTIYLYFKDKEALLHHLSMPYLMNLHNQLQFLSSRETTSPEDNLKDICIFYLRFCLEHQNMYSVFMNAKSTRVDEQMPKLEINQLRNNLFNLLKKVLQKCINISNNDQLLAFTRILYYQLNGILSTYSDLHEPVEILLDRLAPTFELAVEILILGFKEKSKQGVDE